MRTVRWRNRLVALLSLFGCAHLEASQASAAPRAGARYVAMGSSYAAGPEIGERADTPPNRCRRSSDNYPHQLARRLGLDLVDVSCAGATTAHILGAWQELPAQLDAVTPDTSLVTVTIGGNDVGFVLALFAATCRLQAIQAATVPNCPAAAPPTEAQWRALDQSMRRIAAEVKRRAPSAQLIFVDYPLVLPRRGTCVAVGLSEGDADSARAIATRLSAVTAHAARTSGATLLSASRLSRNHDACAAEPWMNGMQATQGNGAQFHPNLQGMTAVAAALAGRAR